MCLFLDGNICFFISAETEKQTEKERSWEKKTTECMEEGRKVVFRDQSAVASFLSPASHLTEQTPSLCWADMGFVKGGLGKTLAVRVVLSAL